MLAKQNETLSLWARERLTRERFESTKVMELNFDAAFICMWPRRETLAGSQCTVLIIILIK